MNDIILELKRGFAIWNSKLNKGRIIMDNGVCYEFKKNSEEYKEIITKGEYINRSDPNTTNWISKKLRKLKF